MTNHEKPEHNKGASAKHSGQTRKTKIIASTRQVKSRQQLEKDLKEREDSRKKVQEAIDWLCKTFPECFNFKKPVPLKRHIEKDIWACMTKEVNFSKTIIKAAIVYYTRNVRYQKAVHSYKHRFDLEGNLVDSVKKVDKDYAEKRIAWVEDKMRKASMPEKISKK